MMLRRALLGVAGSALGVEARAQRVHSIALLSDANAGDARAEARPTLLASASSVIE